MAVKRLHRTFKTGGKAIDSSVRQAMYKRRREGRLAKVEYYVCDDVCAKKLEEKGFVEVPNIADDADSVR